MLILIYYLIFIVILFVRCYEYQVNKIIPTYLNASFYGLKEDIFPRDVTLEISLSRVAGTLLYSIDSRNNQLIVSLSDSNVPTLAIEVNKDKFYLSIPKLCGCELCRFEKLKLSIQMVVDINIRCNNLTVHNHQYNKEGQINKDYPTPSFTKSDKLDAYLWLVNTPQIGDIYPNGDQLRGCIHGVWYNGVEVKMGTHGVTDNCTITCTKDICNSGTCLETYNEHPVCNCTSSFMNGQYCNDTIESRNLRIDRTLIFKKVKLSFRSASDELMTLSNRWTSLMVVGEKEKLIFRISCNNGINVKIDVTISNQYRREKKNILIVEFEKDSLHLKYSNDELYWNLYRVPHNHDLSREVFSILILQSGAGIIDMGYKNNIGESIWLGLSYGGDNVVQLIKKNNATALIHNAMNSFNSVNVIFMIRNLNMKVDIIIVILLLSVVIIPCISVALIMLIRRNQKLSRFEFSSRAPLVDNLI